MLKVGVRVLVRKIMQPDVFCVDQDCSAQELYQELVANSITGAPVLDANDFLVGVVSLTDLARLASGGQGATSDSFYYRNPEQANLSMGGLCEKTKVRDIMNPRIHQLHNDSTVEEALELMLEEDIHRVVVTHRGHVIGIVTSGDMMRTLHQILTQD